MMGMPNNMLSEKTKAKIIDDCVKLGKAVLAVFLGEISNILGGYSETINSKSSADCCEKLTIKEDGAK